MSATAMVGPMVNGFPTPATNPCNEASEYEKILRLRDEIFSGTHPRLTVPAHAVRKVSPRDAQAPFQPQLHATTPVASASGQTAGFNRNEGKQSAPQSLAPAPAPTPKPRATPAAVSEIDPVLLTKSDDLVRAETQLHRQRLEKQLRDQFEQKRLDARKRPAAGEGKPDFDISAVLARALEVTKPDIPPKDKDKESDDETFDENSLYSSRAPDSTPEGPASAESTSPKHQRLRANADAHDADGPAGLRATNVQNVAEAESPEPVTVRPAVSLSAVMGAPLDQSQDKHAYAERPDTSVMDLDDDDEEGEYSPPEAMEQFPTTNEASSRAVQDSRDPRNRPLRRYSELDENGKRPASPSQNMRIVRNHITSPLAPQPSRVSPLALTKQPPFSQNPRARDRTRRQGDQSPETYMPAKKKRKTKGEMRRRMRNGQLSPGVKEEEVSPPPFHDIPSLGHGKLRATNTEPIIIDDGPVHEARYPAVRDRHGEPPSPASPRYVEQTMPLSEPRGLSRTTVRPLRDDQDLRRVASMHNMRVEAPLEYPESVYSTPTRARASTYARIDSPMQETRQIAEMPMEYERRGTPAQEVRVMGTPASGYREVFPGGEREVRYEPIDMPPPPPVERIVVDQYGRRFREIVQERPSVSARPTPLRQDDTHSPTYDNYRQQRAGSVYVDAPERRYVENMPPPAVTYRQVADIPQASAMPPPIPREFQEPGISQQRSGSVFMERPTRQTVFMDDRAEFQEPIRMSSVRPSAARYEEVRPSEMISRGPSVRPVARESSVFIDDRSQVRREYMPVEQPRYRVVKPEERYFDAQGRVVSMNGASDAGPRFVQRY